MGTSFCCLAGRSWANARCKIGSWAVWGASRALKAENRWNSLPLICISESKHPRPDPRNASKLCSEHNNYRSNARQHRSLGPKSHQNCQPLTSSSSLPPHAQRLTCGATWSASRSLRRGNQMIRNGRASLPSVGLMRHRDPALCWGQFLLLGGPIFGQRAVQNRFRGSSGSESCAKSREPLGFSTPHMH